jgi:hypothetical protein
MDFAEENMLESISPTTSFSVLQHSDDDDDDRKKSIEDDKLI